MKEVLIGRDAQFCQIVLPETPDPATSRKHAVLRQDQDGQLWITDISSHGTRVGSRQLAKNKAYALNWGDKVTFANEQQLDWGQVELHFDRQRHHQHTAGLGTVARSLFKSLVGWSENRSHISLFFNMLPNPSRVLYNHYRVRQNDEQGPVGFLLFAFAIYLLCIKYSPQFSEVAEDMNDFQEILFTVMSGVFVLIFGVFLYKMFEVLCGKTISRRTYMYAYIAFNAFSFIMMASFYLVISYVNNDVVGIALLFMLCVFLWFTYHNVRLHALLWGISWWRAFLFLFLSGIIAMLIVGVLVFIAALFFQ